MLDSKRSARGWSCVNIVRGVCRPPVPSSRPSTMSEPCSSASASIRSSASGAEVVGVEEEDVSPRRVVEADVAGARGAPEFSVMDNAQLRGSPGRAGRAPRRTVGRAVVDGDDLNRRLRGTAR